MRKEALDALCTGLQTMHDRLEKAGQKRDADEVFALYLQACALAPDEP